MFIVSLNYKCELEEVDNNLDAHVNYLNRNMPEEILSPLAEKYQEQAV